MTADKTRHLPVSKLITLMNHSDEPWRYEDMILWRASHLGDPNAIAWVCEQVKSGSSSTQPWGTRVLAQQSN